MRNNKASMKLTKTEDKSTVKQANEELRHRQQLRLDTIVADLRQLLTNEAKSKWQFGKLVDEEATAFAVEERTRPRLDPAAKQLPDELHEQTRNRAKCQLKCRSRRRVNRWRTIRPTPL